MLFRRLAKMAAVLVAVVMALAVAPLASAPASGAEEGSPRVAEPFTLTMVEGELVIRDAEPYAMESPTTITGTNDTETGAITGGSLSTPQVNLRQDITSPIAAAVFIDADFSLVTPNTLTGTIDHEGNMTVQASLAVDLHVDVQQEGGGATLFAADCTASPVNLTLGTADGVAYDGTTVTLTDENFSVPEMAVEPSCDPLISGEINNQLAGPGHSLSLTLEGTITPPGPPGCPTATALTANPPGPVDLGTAVDLTATVTPNDPLNEVCIEAAANTQIPAGLVEFFDGATSLGTTALQPDGTATLTTAAIQAGMRDLTAQYIGETPFDKSTSVPLPYQVTADPNFSADLPEFVTIGAAPTEFNVNVTNTGFGTEFTNVRLDVTLRRTATMSLSPARVQLEYLDEMETWVAVPLAVSGTNTLVAAVGATTGFPLPVGEEISQRFRVQFPLTGGTFPTTSCGATNETCPGLVDVAFELVGVDSTGLPAPTAAPSPSAVTAATGKIMLVEAVRRAMTFSPPFGTATPIQPSSVRQGGTIVVRSIILGPLISSGRPTGYVSFKLDDVPIAARFGGIPPDGPALERILLGTSTITASIDLPSNISLGVHRVTLEYLGDARFLPGQFVMTFTVFERPVSTTLFDCLAPGFVNARYRAYVDGFINLPAVRPAGSAVDLAGLSLRLRTSRDPIGQSSRDLLAPANGSRLVGESTLLGLEVTFGPGGSGTAVSLTRSNGAVMTTALTTTVLTGGTPTNLTGFDPSVLDDATILNGTTGSATMDGDPGSLVPITVEAFQFERDDVLGPGLITCIPVGEPLLLGQILASGNELTVEPGGLVSEDDEVLMTSAIEPYTSGRVEFRDGDETVGLANVIDGVARATSSLPVGVRTLTAVYTGGFLTPPLISNAIEIRVVACSPLEEGNGAVVRLVYIELLDRCPDVAGYTYWKSRLDGGLSPEVFATAISMSDEAVGLVVNDAYQTMLERSAEPAGRAFWVSRLKAEGRYDQLLADLAASPEFWALAGGSDEGFIQRLYDRLLARAADPDGLAYWLARLDAGVSHRRLVLTFANRDEHLGRLVDGAYNQILDRAPDSTERSDGIDFLRATGDRMALNGQLIGLSEFLDRAETFPDID